jgi:hypothetical protein
VLDDALLVDSPCDKATPPTLASGCAHAATNRALNSLLYSRRRGRPSFENCFIVSTILQSWTRCPLLKRLSIWGHRTDTKRRTKEELEQDVDHVFANFGGQFKMAF